MPRVKVQRKSTAIDMTAMCDVAFLLLTFFILTAKPKPEDPIKAEVPQSVITQPVPDDNMATLTVGQGKVFFSVDGTDVRKQLLQQMAEKYQQKFSQAEYDRFAVTEVFGVPFNALHQFLALTSEQKKTYQQPGIPNDTTANNELFNWIREARVAAKVLHNKELRVSIKGDSHEEYPTIKKVVSILQKQKVNKFSLITALRAAPKK